MIARCPGTPGSRIPLAVLPHCITVSQRFAPSALSTALPGRSSLRRTSAPTGCRTNDHQLSAELIRLWVLENLRHQAIPHESRPRARSRRWIRSRSRSGTPLGSRAQRSGLLQRSVRAGPVGAESCVTQCELGVFAEQAAEPVTSEDAHTHHGCGRALAPGLRSVTSGGACRVGGCQNSTRDFGVNETVVGRIPAIRSTL